MQAAADDSINKIDVKKLDSSLHLLSSAVRKANEIVQVFRNVVGEVPAFVKEGEAALVCGHLLKLEGLLMFEFGEATSGGPTNPLKLRRQVNSYIEEAQAGGKITIEMLHPVLKEMVDKSRWMEALV